MFLSSSPPMTSPIKWEVLSLNPYLKVKLLKFHKKVH